MINECTEECTSGLGPRDWDNLIATRMHETIIAKELENLVVLDLGANVGIVTTQIADFLQVKKIYAVEPLSFNFKNLVQNTSHKNAEKIKLIQVAVSNTNGTTKLYSGVGSPESCNITKFFKNENETAWETAQCCTLDYLSEKLQVSFDIIKIDVEGAELLVFEGGMKTLKKCKYIFLEIHSEEIFKQVLQLAKQNEFKVTCLKNGHEFNLDTPTINSCYQIVLQPSHQSLQA